MAIINQITLLTVVLTGAAVIREREHGTLEHLLVMPLTAFEIMMAKVWANGLVILVAAACRSCSSSRGVLEVPFAGSVALFLVGVVLYLFFATALGIFLGTIARSMAQFALLIMIPLIPLLMLLRAAARRARACRRPADRDAGRPDDALRELAQAILYRGAGLDVVWRQFVVLFAIGAALFGYALARFRATIGTMM